MARLSERPALFVRRSLEGAERLGVAIVGDQSQDVVNHDAAADGVVHIVAERHDATGERRPVFFPITSISAWIVSPTNTGSVSDIRLTPTNARPVP